MITLTIAYMRVANNNLTIEYISKLWLSKNKTLSKKQVKAILYSYNKIISDLIISKGFKIKLPHRVGDLQIKKQKMGFYSLKLDYAEWNKSRTKVFHTNNHSDGWYAKCYWSRGRVINAGWYTFEFTRGNQRALSKVMKTEQGHQIYRAWS